MRKIRKSSVTSSGHHEKFNWEKLCFVMSKEKPETPEWSLEGDEEKGEDKGQSKEGGYYTGSCQGGRAGDSYTQYRIKS